MNYFLHILIIIGIYSVLGMSLNLLAGYSGLLSICHAAFYGLGAYVTGLLAIKFQMPWLVTVLSSTAICVIAAWAIGKTALRFRDDLFVIATFAFQVIIFGLMLNWTELTQGPMGLPGIPQPSVAGWKIDDNWEFLILAMVLEFGTFIFLRRLVNSPYGRCLKGIREDEAYMTSVGKDTAGFKTSAFIVGAVLAGICGSFYAGYITFIDPSSFTVGESIFILAIVIIGGSGTLGGPVVGAVVLVVLPELLRFIGLPTSVAANLRQIIYGGLLVAFMMWRPRGFLGEYAFQGKEARE
jgi:branched-chain amino acid transport system permease protein